MQFEEDGILGRLKALVVHHIDDYIEGKVTEIDDRIAGLIKKCADELEALAFNEGCVALYGL